MWVSGSWQLVLLRLLDLVRGKDGSSGCSVHSQQKGFQAWNVHSGLGILEQDAP